jgi:uncharacterized protein involved in type VI secretion and phage assembly
VPAPTHTSQAYFKIDGADAPPDLVEALVSFTVDSTLNMPSMFVIEMHDVEPLSANSGALKWVDNALISIGKTVEVSTSENIASDTSTATQHQLIKGEITSIEPIFDTSGKTRLIIRGYDKTHRLHRHRRTKVYRQVTDSDIIGQLCNIHGLTKDVGAASQVFDHVYQHNQTDFEFLAGRVRRMGFAWIYANDKLIIDSPERLVTRRTAVTLEYGSNLLHFQPRLSSVGQQHEVNVRGWDPTTKAEILGKATSATIGYNVQSLNGKKVALDFGANPEVLTDALVFSQAEADQVAKALLNGSSAGFVQGEGVAEGTATLLAGTPLTLTGAGNRFSTTYFVTRATHTFNATEGYTTAFEVAGLAPSTIGYLLDTGAGSAESVGRHAQVFGVVPAIVTNNDDSADNNPTQMGMVRVKFPTLTNDLESTWARIAQPLAGPETGFYIMPQVNDEVLVMFENGDFNRPYVVGSLWNGTDKLPSEAQGLPPEDRPKVHILKTKEKSFVLLDDRSNSKSIELKTSEGHHIIIDAKNKKIELKTSGGHEIVIDDGGQKITMKTGQQSMEMASGGITLKGSVVNVEATGAVNIKGATVNLN